MGVSFSQKGIRPLWDIERKTPCPHTRIVTGGDSGTGFLAFSPRLIRPSLLISELLGQIQVAEVDVSMWRHFPNDYQCQLQFAIDLTPGST